MSRWFRVYDELLDDPKAQRLAPELFKAWVNILCVASRGGGKIPEIEDVAFALRVTRDVTRDWLHALRERGLIDVDPDGSMSPHNWGGRQYRSDADPTAAERQARKRARDSEAKSSSNAKPIKPVTPQNVTRDVTPPRDRTETETETEASFGSKTRDAFAEFWRAWPNKVGKPAAEKAFKPHGSCVDAVLAGVARYIAAKPPDRAWLNPATFLNQRRWEDAPAPTSANARGPPPSRRPPTALSTFQRIANGTYPLENHDIFADEAPAHTGPTIEGRADEDGKRR